MMRLIARLWSWCNHEWNRHVSKLACFFAVLSLMLGVLALVQWRELRYRGIPPDWGNVPEWVAAFGTLAAFGALAVTASQWLGAMANQARLIIVEPARQADGTQKFWDFAADDDIVIQNHSDAPVFNLVIDSLDYESTDRLVWENFRAAEPRRTAGHAVFRPGERTGHLTVVGKIEGGTEASNPELKYLVFTFTDANGRRWRRTGTGQPVRVWAH